MSTRVRVIGAGMAGLSAAVALARAGVATAVSDGAAQAGGRCRSYHDPQLGRMIDNGNHLVLSGNAAVLRYLATIGANDRLSGPEHAEFAFVDVRQALPRHPRAGVSSRIVPRTILDHAGHGQPDTDPASVSSDVGADSGAPAFARVTGGVVAATNASRWTVRINDGRVPWWIFDRKRRVPGTTLGDYLPLARLLSGSAHETVADRIETSGPLWDTLLEPVLLAALNTAAADGSAKLAAAVIRESIGKGGRATCPRIAEPTLAAAFVDPAIDWLAGQGSTVTTGQRVRALRFDGDRVAALNFGAGEEVLGPDESVVLAVPPWVAATLVPDLTVPDEFRAIVNAHFAYSPPPGTPPMIGVIGGAAEWIFAFPDRLSVTVSAAEHLVETDRLELAQTFWAEIAAIHHLPPDLPPWQIVKEKRATFAATPAQDAKRPPAGTSWRNLFLAGDWTQTGLPATIEGAIRSGETAARLALAAAVR